MWENVKCWDVFMGLRTIALPTIGPRRARSARNIAGKADESLSRPVVPESEGDLLILNFPRVETLVWKPEDIKPFLPRSGRTIS